MKTIELTCAGIATMLLTGIANAALSATVRLPPSGKPLDLFVADDNPCRNYVKERMAVQSTPRVEVTAPETSDDELASEVRQKIGEQPSLKFFRIAVRSVNHAVYLDGQVDTRRDGAEAEDVAGSVPGVRNVYNHLYVSDG